MSSAKLTSLEKLSFLSLANHSLTQGSQVSLAVLELLEFFLFPPSHFKHNSVLARWNTTVNKRTQKALIVTRFFIYKCLAFSISFAWNVLRPACRSSPIRTIRKKKKERKKEIEKRKQASLFTWGCCTATHIGTPFVGTGNNGTWHCLDTPPLHPYM